MSTNGSSSFDNTGTFEMTGAAALNGDYTNSGIIYASDLTLNAGGTLDISGGTFIANNLTLNSGSISSGAGSSCAAFLIKGNTDIASSTFEVGSGEVVIVDSTANSADDFNNCPDASNCGLTFGSENASADCFNNVLPLTWLEFQVNKLNDQIELYWITAKEENVSHFEIQSSIDGENYDSIGVVLAENQYFNQYTFYAKKIANQHVYYRIKQIDYDGKFTYSELKVIQETEFLVDVYPNPIENALNISFYTEDLVSVKLLDYMGNVIFQEIIFDKTIINTQFLTSGLYVLIVENNLGERIEKRIIKE